MHGHEIGLGEKLAAVENLKPFAVAPVPARRVLVAEDNAVTNDLLRLLLAERGHDVDIVEDGEQALKALNSGHYDVVLMDFHLPKLNGLDVASRYRSGAGNEKSPRFIAITSDVKGLLAHPGDCENFDTLVPKPLDLDSICKVIEGEAREVSVSPIGTASPARPGAAALSVDDSNVLSSLDGARYNFLRWPDDFAAARLSARGLHASLGDSYFDAILICQPLSESDLAMIWRTKSLHALPIIDLTGKLGRRADLDASRLAREDTGAVEELIAGFHERRARIHADLLYSDDVADKLLARAFVSAADLMPAYDGAERDIVAYNTILAPRSVCLEAGKLAARGLLAANFFDRTHQCDRCGSSRFNVREVCSHCRSANLTEEAYLHHFLCANQGPESDYRQGDDLVCPKCRRELSHFSVDYDKPGSVLKCGCCGKAEFEADVGFVCLDCEAQFSGDSVPTTDIHSYSLTDDGRAYVESGQAALGDARAMLRFAELPVGLVVALNRELTQFRDAGVPFTLIELSYGREREIVHREGPRQFEAARDLFLENLRNGLSSADHVFRGHAYDFVLLSGTGDSAAQANLDEIRTQASDLLRIDLGIEMRVHGADVFV